MKITIRQATPSDAPTIARIIAYGFGEDMLRQYCGEQGLQILEALAHMEVSQYSYHHALIAEIDGKPVGAIVGYDGAQLQQLRRPTLAYIAEQAGFMPQIQEETEPGEYYLDSLAVFPEYQHQGIGKQLILALCDKAYSQGHQRVGLLVDMENPKAERLYSSLGFQRINQKTLFNHQLWHMQQVNPLSQSDKVR